METAPTPLERQEGESRHDYQKLVEQSHFEGAELGQEYRQQHK